MFFNNRGFLQTKLFSGIQMTEKSELDVLNRIERLCIVNFLELQEIKRKLNITTESDQDVYDYKNAVEEYLTEMDNKMKNLIKDYSHLLKS